MKSYPPFVNQGDSSEAYFSIGGIFPRGFLPGVPVVVNGEPGST